VTRTQTVAHGFLVHAILLLIAFAVVSLVGAVKFLGDDPLATTLPYHQVNSFASVLLQLAILSGMLGGGVYMAASSRADNQASHERLLVYTFRLWNLVVALGAAAGLLGLLDGRSGLERPPFLDIGVGAAVVLVIANVLKSTRVVSSIVPVWAIGMALYVAGSVVGRIPPGDFAQDRMLRALAVGIHLYIAFPVAAVAFAFWLMHRISNITLVWAEMGVNVVAGFVALAGALLTLPLFYSLVESNAIRALGSIGVVVVPVVYVIFAAHSYRAFSDRNTNATLSAQWLALGVLLFLTGAGLLGGIGALPGVRDFIAGTRLTDLQSMLMQFAVVAVLLGVFNQVAAELRGQNRRVTGLMPFWLVAFGVIGGGAALAAAGVVQVYLERLLSVGYLETQTLMIPLYTLWFVGLVTLTFGVVIYALGFWVRRPKARDVVKSNL
jgi:nitric oxide reductase subunit B